MKDTLLIVDDSVEVISSLSATLKNDYSIRAAKSGETALDLLLTGVEIHCILLDLTLPGIDGFTVCQKIQESPGLADIPIIIITSTIDPEVETRGLQAGAVDFLTKPINPPIVRARIKNHLFIYHQQQKLKNDYQLLNTLHTNLINNAPLGITFLDESLNIRVWNHFLEDFSGYSLEEMNFEKLVSLFPKLDKDSIKRVQKNEESLILEELAIYHNNKERIVRLQLSGFPSSTDAGGMLMVIADITDRVIAENEQIKLREQLLQSQKMEAMGTLAGGIAHDFNNILGVIIGSASLLLQDVNQTDENLQYCDDILSASYRAKDLVGQILSFSRKKTSQKEILNIDSIVNETVSFMKASLPSTVHIITQNSSENSLILADSTEIHQVLMNLCTNAFHAMKNENAPASGTITISQEMVHLEENTFPNCRISTGEYTHLSISDTGCGIPKDILMRIFDPYFTTKEVGKGTGLGLSVVQGIIINHGGVINVDSVIGEGTVFNIYLPVVKGVEMEQKEGHPPKTIGPGIRILVVDDEILLTKVISTLLQRSGCIVTVENNPLLALEQLKSEGSQFDLAILDKNMPHMNGYQLARALRDENISTPLLLSTGYLDPGERESEDMKLFSGAIQKPYRKSELIETIRKVVVQ